MSYAILRTAKLKTMGEIGGSLAHTYRTRETPNADPERADKNEHQGGDTPEAVMQAIYDRLPEKRRSDAVLCVEYFVGASPEHFQNGQDGSAYFAAAVEWLQERHGAENVVATSIHRDETSPHLVAYVVPLDDQGKLNAKQFLGGKAKLSAMQTDFAEKIGRMHGLERGIEGSKAKHTSIRAFYGALKRGEVLHAKIGPHSVEPKVLRKGLFSKDVEGPEMIAERLTQGMHRHYDPVLQEAATVRLERRRADEMARTAKAHQKAKEAAEKRLQEVTKPMQGLTKEQVAEIARMVFIKAHEFRVENERQKQAQKEAKQDRGFSR